MNRERLKEICDTWKVAIVEEDADRYLMIMALDIERETRYECVSKAYDLANELADLNKESK